MFLESRGMLTQIDDHIVDRSHRTSNELGLFMRSGLKVQSAKGALSPVKRYAALHQPWIQPMRFKLTLTPSASKKATFVVLLFRFKDKRVRESGGDENHE